MSLRSRLNLTAEPLYLMDGSAFIFRSFYAFRSMSRSDGFPTNVLYMVARLILRLLREERPESLVFVMDGKGKTFRHERFAAYKSQRPPTPEDLAAQLGPLRELLGLMAVPVLVSSGCEADDCIASLALRNRDQGPVVIVGADKDLKQCLHENVLLWDPAAKDEKITTLEDFHREHGMEPSSWPDYQALVGDSSDNIPGVPKIGPKSAGELIRDFHDLETLFARLPAVPPKLRSKLEGQEANAFLYRELTRLTLDACPEADAASLRLGKVNLPDLLDFMNAYELRALAREAESMARAGFFNGARPARDKGASLPRQDGAPLGQQDAASPAPSPTSAPPRRDEPGSALPAAGGLLASSRSGPQPVEAFARPKAALQGGLFDAGVAKPEFIMAAPDDLPATAQDSPLALLLLEQGLLLAAENWERLIAAPAQADSTAKTQADSTAKTQADATAPVKADATDPARTRPAAPVAPAAMAALAAMDQELLAKLFSGRLLVTPDYKALCRALPFFRSLPDTAFFDLSLAAYLLEPEDRSHGLTQIAARWQEPCASPHSPLTNPGLLALDLAAFFREQLEGAALDGVFRQLEMPLAPVLAVMEQRGIRIDRAAFAAFLQEVQRDIEDLSGRIHALAGRNFNIRSAQQLGDVLFAGLGLSPAGKTKGGAASTSDEVLEKLSGAHEIVGLVQQYRKLEKLRSTYLEPLPKLADDEDRIHTTFNQTATATGRLSSSNPNLQNIPVRGDFGRRMRSCFVAAPGKALVCADYSQIELRVLAHLSGDATLLEAFAKGQDIHSRTAALLFDLPLEEVSTDMRRNAKTINFGLVYGMGAQKLAQEMHVGLKEAKAFIERYFERLGTLKAFYDSVEREAARDGWVTTMTGRRRLTPDISSRNKQLQAQARRQAINTRIQGSAADIIKLAMIAVENDPELAALEARLLLQIHDELLLEAPADKAEAAGKRLALLMSGVQAGAQALSVPLLVDWGTGPSWASAH